MTINIYTSKIDPRYSIDINRSIYLNECFNHNIDYIGEFERTVFDLTIVEFLFEYL